MQINEYFKKIEEDVGRCYAVAKAARAKGFDPAGGVEVPIARTLAEKAVGLISTMYPQMQNSGITERIFELEKEYGPLDIAVSFKIAEEIAKEKFCKFESLLQAIEAGVRVGFAYNTLGVVSSPLEGFTELKLGKTREGKDYFKAYFSGPIRSAGTTASCVVLMLIDYLRENFGFAKFDPDEKEVKRYVTENYDYHEKVSNLQYLPTEAEIAYLAERIPIQIAGEPSAQREVSNYKDLQRVETNLIRGGMCLIFSEGLAQKAQKGYRLLKGVKAKGFQSTGWDFLDEFINKFKMTKKDESKDSVPVYIKDLVAGRPVYGHPSKSGGFRFRYGRSRAGGFSATSIHPATMGISNGFLSFGTQLKIEKPTKGCAVSVCDEMDGPIVKLRNGSVKKINNYEEAKKIYPNVEEIIYLGDILISFDDVLNRNYNLLKSGYVEEWWELELKKKVLEKGEKIEIRDKFNVGFDDAVAYSDKYGIGFYPRFIFYWKEIRYEQFFGLIDWIAKGEIIDGKIILPFGKIDKERYASGKRALELIGCEHEVGVENVIIRGDEAKAVLLNLGIEFENGGLCEKAEKIISKLEELKEEKDVLNIINKLCKFKIKDKSGTFIGARMGRPEKSKLRKLIGSPHVIFPVGAEGGRLRSFLAAYDVGHVEGDFPIYLCEKCKKESIYPKCAFCGDWCKKMNYCSECGSRGIGKCMEHDKGMGYMKRKIDIRYYFDLAKKITKLRNEDLGKVIKGVRGTSNEDHSCENLAKGLLRARNGLHVNKDGTIRYDMTEMAITHFKPKEIGTSVEKLKEMGYEKDTFGNEFSDENQVLEMFPHDVILPSCPDSGDERADDVFFSIAKFIDDELENLYGMERFFNVKSKNDVIGQYVVCLAPHICTGTVGRIIGFSKTQTLLASPFMHAAMRRDADGDEAAAMLLMDMLINFSRKFLPAHRGGTQDSPLVLNTCIRAGDVDDQILDFTLGDYPLELYELCEQGKHSSEVHGVDNVKKRLKEGRDPFVGIKFSHNCSNLNGGVVNSSYKFLPSMSEKVGKQMELCGKIRAVDVSDVARLVIERHFIRDIKGNLRKFSMQAFRCVNCNEIYRRVPLAGKCLKCGGRLIFTISEGSILKYMQPALELARKYNVSDYLTENLELTEMYVQSIFGKEKEKQESIEKWF
jgi:DNA polymerase II large subunit